MKCSDHLGKAFILSKTRIKQDADHANFVTERAVTDSDRRRQSANA